MIVHTDKVNIKYISKYVYIECKEKKSRFFNERTHIYDFHQYTEIWEALFGTYYIFKRKGFMGRNVDSWKCGKLG